jgi:hypothetical protein
MGFFCAAEPGAGARPGLGSTALSLSLYCSTALNSNALAQRRGWREDPANFCYPSGIKTNAPGSSLESCSENSALAPIADCVTRNAWWG